MNLHPFARSPVRPNIYTCAERCKGGLIISLTATRGETSITVRKSPEAEEKQQYSMGETPWTYWVNDTRVADHHCHPRDVVLRAKHDTSLDQKGLADAVPSAQILINLIYI